MLFLQAGGPTQSQLSRPMSSGHHISMKHRLRRKQLNSDTNASNETCLKEIQEKRKEETFSSEKWKRKINNEKRDSGVTVKWAFPDSPFFLVHRGKMKKRKWKTLKNQKMKKWTKNENIKSKKKDKQMGEEKVRKKKVERALRGTPRDGPQNWIFTPELSREIVTKLRPTKNQILSTQQRQRKRKKMKENERKWKKMKENERKWKKMKENERKWKKMKENERKWKKKDRKG